ncbi:MAG: SDR family NAD(P)-dependent oxidoreductase [Saccharofermentans sp.]|nr:SDR family NAD(P)-dependent oxidoreductase [Saccharofermentans sp.]
MDRIAIVTGATSGIGEAFIKLLKSRSDVDKIWVVGRNGEKLRTLAEDMVISICADLSETIEPITERLRNETPDVVFLINSAGLGTRQDFASTDEEKISAMLDVNCRALTLLTRAVIPYMKAGSKIINIASSAGFLPQPGFTVYAASKSYVISFSRAIRQELKGKKITVTCVNPGPVETDFNRRATGSGEGFKGFRKSISKKPDEIAVKSLRAADKGKAMLTPGMAEKLFRFAAKIIPHSWILKLIKW